MNYESNLEIYKFLAGNLNPCSDIKYRLFGALKKFNQSIIISYFKIIYF